MLPSRYDLLPQPVKITEVQTQFSELSEESGSENYSWRSNVVTALQKMKRTPSVSRSSEAHDNVSDYVLPKIMVPQKQHS